MPGTFTNILVHIVFSTKERRPLVTPDVRERLYAFIGGIVRNERGSLLAIGGMPDHLHLLVRWRSDGALADLVRHVKSRSSLWIHEEFAERKEFAWQEGYGAFSVSESIREAVRVYIESQEQHHRVRTFQDEFLEFLRAHRVTYDERHVFG